MAALIAGAADSLVGYMLQHERDRARSPEALCGAAIICAGRQTERSVRFRPPGTGLGVTLGTSSGDRLPWPGGDLTPLEEQMVAKAATGKLVDRGGGPFNLDEIQAWGEERTVRAVVLRHLLVAEQWPIDAKGVRLRGVRISGRLDMEAAALRCPLLLDCCYLDADAPACLNSATASRITVAGCQLAGLTGEMLSVREFDLSGSTLTGPLCLRDADITGRLACRGAQLTGTDSDGNALDADRLKVGGNVFLDGGFTAAGAVRLGGADIVSQLSCRGAQLTVADNDGNALFADRLRVGGDVFLDRAFTAAGVVWVVGADIGGRLSCNGAQLTGTDSDGSALHADRMKAGGDVSFDEGFTSAGALRLINADIGGQLSCRSAQLTGHNEDGFALIADRIKTRDSMWLDGGFAAAGTIRLDDADIGGRLDCSGAQLTAHDKAGYALFADGMRTGGHVFLAAGFVALGGVWLAGADIGGHLSCRGAQMTGRNGGHGMCADGMQVRRNVLLDGGFTAAAGAIRLAGARVGGEVTCSGARLTGRDEGGCALLADGLRTGGDVVLDAGFTAAGTIRLAGAEVGDRLRCGSAQLAGHDGGYALSAEEIKVSGSVPKAFEGPVFLHPLAAGVPASGDAEPVVRSAVRPRACLDRVRTHRPTGLRSWPASCGPCRSCGYRNLLDWAGLRNPSCRAFRTHRVVAGQRL
jgi:hypothetical protein